MALALQTFQQIVDSQLAAVQANANPTLDVSIGSVVLALTEANAANSIWLQALATTLLSVTRLATSSGIDVDTFIADFGFSRQQGNASAGSVTFSRFTDTTQGVVPVGTIVADSQNNLTFIITLDTGNANYNSGLNAYVAAISTPSITVPCACQTTGTIGNVAAGAIDTIQSPNTTPGIDTVTNADPFVTGADPWSDTFTKTAFLDYINSLSRATLQAIQFAVTTTNVGTNEFVKRYNIVENVNESTATQLGYFFVVIDNGTGSQVSDALKNAVADNIELYRGLTIQYNVDKAVITTVTIAVSVKLVSAPTESNDVIKANIKQALFAYSLTIPIGQPFLYSQIAFVVMNSDPNILNIPNAPGPNPTLDSNNIDVAGDNLHAFSCPIANVTVTIL